MANCWRWSRSGCSSSHGRTRARGTPSSASSFGRTAGEILVFDHRGLPVEAAPGYGGGWDAHMDALQARLGVGALPDWFDRYRELAPLYEAQEAALR